MAVLESEVLDVGRVELLGQQAHAGDEQAVPVVVGQLDVEDVHHQRVPGQCALDRHRTDDRVWMGEVDAVEIGGGGVGRHGAPGQSNVRTSPDCHGATAGGSELLNSL